jgi:hypothetical protein
MENFNEVVSAAGDGTVSPGTFQLFIEEIGAIGPANADALVATAVAMSTGALDDLCNFLVDSETDIFIPPPLLVCSNDPPSTFLRGTTDEGTPQLQLTIPCAGGTPVDTTYVNLEVEACKPLSGDTNIEQAESISFASLRYVDPSTGDVYDMRPVFAVILDKLDSLLKCCPPCDKGPIYQDQWPVPADPETPQLYGTWNLSQSAVNPTGGVDEVWTSAMSFSTPIDTTIGNPDVGKYGRFWWIYDCLERSAPIFINFATQKFMPPGGNIIGFSYHLNYGVSCTFNIKNSPRPGFGQW